MIGPGTFMRLASGSRMVWRNASGPPGLDSALGMPAVSKCLGGHGQVNVVIRIVKVKETLETFDGMILPMLAPPLDKVSLDLRRPETNVCSVIRTPGPTVHTRHWLWYQPRWCGPAQVPVEYASTCLVELSVASFTSFRLRLQIDTRNWRHKSATNPSKRETMDGFRDVGAPLSSTPEISRGVVDSRVQF